MRAPERTLTPVTIPFQTLASFFVASPLVLVDARDEEMQVYYTDFAGREAAASLASIQPRRITTAAT
jgi:hypothetical protein